jgi:hypothetical protein
LQQLSYLAIVGCCRLKATESKAPNLSNFSFNWKDSESLAWTNTQMKNLTMYRVVWYARAELPCIMPNLDTLVLSSYK